MSTSWDETLLEDFLTESGELIEQLDRDLVRLEHASGDESTELLNSIFRAMHTIKGAAGFLNVQAVTTFAHAAEDALNHLRKGAAAVDASVIDTLLRSVDVLRAMVGQLASGQLVDACGPELIAALAAVAARADQPPGAPCPDEPTRTEDGHDQAHGGAGEVRPLNLPAQKRDLLGFMTADLRDTAAQLSQCVQQAALGHERAEAGVHLIELAQGLDKTADFFELAPLHALARLLDRCGQALAQLPDASAMALMRQVELIALRIQRQAQSLDRGEVADCAADDIEHQIESLLRGADATTPEGSTDASGSASDSASEGAGASRGGGGVVAEKTIRVELARLESLLNSVGQLVLAKNRMLGMTRRLHDHGLPQELYEQIGFAANDLDRVTASLQLGVMRTRMQPLAKLFDRYPRVIRDIARATDKQIQLRIAGADTEVDKGVLELLADPLVHILRNSADHGIESPSARRESGKPASGTIRLLAEHQGSHVRILIEDDGKGMDRQVIADKAVSKGLAGAEQVASMSDEEVYRFIFAAGFSTAERVSDLSGRGVGMDVVRTNVNRMNGTIQVRSEKGRGTWIEILIPLTVAIMPAMSVQVGRHLYCVPLQHIAEIVRPEPAQLGTVNGRPTLRLRESVLALLDLRRRLGEPCESPARFAVVIEAAGQRVGLLVDRLVGQQDIVIKPLDDAHARGGPFSGATIQDDGRVSLILDVAQLLRQAEAYGSAGEARQAA